jgi:predicted DCC family thiol-disulfide oxidoreductase YuxK
MTDSRATVIYDGECEACTRWAETLGRQNGASQLDIVSSGSAAVRERFATIPREDFAGSLQLVLPDGSRLAGANAIETLVTMLPRWRWLAPLFSLPFARPVADRVYRWIAAHRHMF